MAAPNDGGLSEILVTARRRAEDLQDTPIAVTAVSGAELESRGLADVTNITSFTPNLTFEGTAPISGSNAAAFAFIRGVGQTDFNQLTEPGVGVYLDGVYLGRSVGQVMSTLDLERIEVLRGPQGTLFGRNAIGGAISVITKKPTRDFEGYVDVTVGRDDRHDVKAALNVPITDRLFARLTAATINRDGYIHRQPDGLDLGDKDKLVGRLALRWQPVDALIVDLSIDGDRERENGAPASLVAVNTQPVTGQPVGALPNFPAIANCLAQGLPPVAPLCTDFAGAIGDPRFYNAQWLPRNRFVTYGAGPFADGDDFRSDLDLWGANLTVAVETAFGELKSITAYRDLKGRFGRDDDHSPLLITATSNDYRQDQFSQELQLNGELAAGRLTYTLGGYYFEERGTDINRVATPIARFQSGGSIKNDSKAVFGQATFRATEALSITAGLRYTDETKRYTPDQFYLTNPFGLPGLNPAGALGVGPAFSLIQPLGERRKRFREWTPMVNASYAINDAVMAYLTYARGYKSGGFTQRIFPAQLLVPDFNPEFVDSYEAGVKSELFDRRLRLNGAAFYADYQNIQVIVQEGFAPHTKNAAAARVTGFELEASAVPVDALLLQFAAGYTNARYRTLGPRVVGLTPESAFPYTPRWTLSGSAAYMFEGAFGEITPRLDWSFRDSFFTDAANTRVARQGAYHLLNASVAWRPRHSGLAVSLGVTNLTDTRYFPVASGDLPVKGNVEANWARPREWYASARYSF